MKRLNGGKQMTSVWTIDAPPREEKVFGKHPTQKPVALLERIIVASTDEDDLVLDPFSGSATTGIAAARLNRRYVGIEVETEFIDLSKKRYKREYLEAGPSSLLERARQMDASEHRGVPSAQTLFSADMDDG
jgi:site-specific DNA-methyltransferase (adenine-specific)